MRILGIVGSPRKGGNTDRLVREVLKGAAAHGANSEVVYLNDLRIRPCQACYFCKDKDDTCKLRDDMAKLYKKLQDANGIVLGSPVYMAQVTAQTKLMVDRLFAFFTKKYASRLRKGKRAVLITTQGAKDLKVFRHALDLLRSATEWLGVKVVGTLIGNGLGPKGAAAKRKDLLKKAFALGEKLYKQSRAPIEY